ncbi:PAS domain S-box protein [Archangium lansingense]|uniref:histidine kinase n=1 Tax=Archangium lansingense TaxID=2995310 RepID=A0ABT3ZZT4_9BACT|nr:PAS domain S-box protein [Archangium lansinium]MCY1074586.1 PAS domain S-box protein [Archangium lansinium]
MSGQIRKLLVISSHAGLRAELRRWLENAPENGYELTEFVTGPAGVRGLNAGDLVPDCVLLAHEPPALDALEVLAVLQADRPMPPCPVVILPVATADGRETRRAALRAGAMDFIERNALNMQALNRAIEDAIDRFAPWRTDPTFTRSMDHIGSSRAQLYAVINAMADGVVVFDMAGSVVLLNDAEAWINGFETTSEMMRDLSFFAECYELSSDDGQIIPVTEWPVSRVLRGETITELRLRARRLDTGQAWHIQFSGAPVRDETGKQVLALVITRDLTDHVRAEQALRTSQRRYQTLFQSIDEGFCIVQILFDEHGKPSDYRFLETNAAFKRHTGLANAVGKTARQLVPRLEESWFRLYGNVALTGEAIRIEDHALAMKRWFEVYATRAGEPEERQVAIVFKDITVRKQAEQALRESEARAHQAAAKAEAESRLLDAVLEAAPAGIILADASGRVVRMNPANERLWGPAPATAGVDEYGNWKGWWADGSERHGRGVTGEEWALARALRGELIPGDIVEIEPFNAPGTRRTMVNSGAPVRDAAGRILGAVVAQMDITARLEAEKAVRRSEERYRLVSRATNDVIWDWDLTTDLVDWNDAVLVHIGCTREELGPSIQDWSNRIHPEDHDRVVAGIRAAIDGGQETWTDEYRFRRSDGSYAAFLDRGHIGRDASGKPIRMIGSMLDLTEHHRAEAALRESKERFEALADNISQLAWMTDETGYIFWYNQRWFDFTGTTPEEMQSWGWQKFHHPDHVQRVTERFMRHIATGEVWEDTFPLRSKTGEYRWFLSRARPIRDGAGGPVRRWFGTNTDITEQLEAEERLKEALRARDEFLSIASHELKTPLTSLKLQFQMMHRRIERGDPDAHEPERVDKLVEQAHDQVSRLARLVGDMLDIARIQTGRLAIEPGPVNAVELTREVLERMSPHLAEAGTPATLEAPERLEVEWDHFRIEQVVTNLLTNAMRYGNHKPVDVRLRSHEGCILLSVKDQGIGIAKESQERIFNRFERAISASDVSGLGLGLFISRQIVEAHGGRIWVESEGPGLGATFFVELPAHPGVHPLRRAGAERCASPRRPGLSA